MNNNDNGYIKAQRAYDNQLPPDDDWEDCDECGGTGKLPDPADLEGDEIECPSCEGKKGISPSEARREAYEDYLERKAEEARDEELIERHNNKLDLNSKDYSAERSVLCGGINCLAQTF